MGLGRKPDFFFENIKKITQIEERERESKREKWESREKTFFFQIKI